MKCAHNGCDKEAAGVFCVRVPATGWALGTHQPLELKTNLPTCQEHIPSAKDFLDHNKEITAGLDAQCTARGLALPDYDRAWVELVPPEEADASRN